MLVNVTLRYLSRPMQLQVYHYSVISYDSIIVNYETKEGSIQSFHISLDHFLLFVYVYMC